MVEREWVAENLDKVTSLEIRPQGFLNNIVPRLYAQVRRQVGEPIIWRAATDLRMTCSKNSVIYIATGHVHPDILPNGETDGPPGAAALAKSIRIGLKARVMLLCEPSVLGVMRETCWATGLQARKVSSTDDLKDAAPRTVGLMSFPIGLDEAMGNIEQLMRADVSAVITLEKIGRNSDGIYNTGLGNDVSDSLSKVDLLVDRAREDGIITVGIGDLGNEIGFGNIQEIACTIVPYPQIVTTVSAKHLIVAGVSNWGAYGIAAALAVQLEDLELAHTAELEKRAILACCRAGAVDGLSGGPTNQVDGLDYRTHMAIVEILHNIVNAALTERKIERMSFEVEEA